MALSNMRREPQREITESAIGVGALIVFVGLDILLAKGLMIYSSAHGWDIEKAPFGMAMLMALLLSILLAIVLIGGTVFTHFLGEEVCGWMARRGMDPRPTVRK